MRRAAQALVVAGMVAGSAPAGQAQEWRVDFPICGSVRHTCIVDGDTIWLEGNNLRLESFDTLSPITTSAVAGRRLTSPIAPARG